ncbi:hypothetical protein [Streptomyces sp. A1547]|uniref:hypothetical protein n=1 Tax=Streptomyces sp. A1547 TaxID=2563105 RepID=UPI00109E817D|nr:hypothetical protein [Streptomyces sp. A1547]THA41794.1 hypothetical protein E6W17_02590 [Streptomyces sp. A1547]
MKLEDARQAYYDASDKASEIARSLALAGIGIVWLLAGGLTTSGIKLTQDQLWALILLAACLCFDLLQYLYKTIAWSWWARIKEPHANADGEVGKAKALMNRPSWFFFTLKMMSMAAAYCFIFIDLASRLSMA